MAGDTFFPALAKRSHVFALNSDWFISLPWSSVISGSTHNSFERTVNFNCRKTN